jgi:hypothetical protein
MLQLLKRPPIIPHSEIEPLSHGSLRAASFGADRIEYAILDSGEPMLSVDEHLDEYEIHR